MQSLTFFALLSAPLLALAKTDLGGCTSSTAGASLIWYVPGTGELCELLDCGGGRAPPKTTVPGCAAYSGTATYSPNYLPGYGPDATPTSAPVVSSPVVPTAPGPVVTSSAALPSSASSAASSSASSMPSHISSVASSISVKPSSISSSVKSVASSAVPVVHSSSTLVSTMRGNTTVPSPTPSAFPGEAAHVGAKIGLLGFIGAVVALL